MRFRTELTTGTGNKKYIRLESLTTDNQWTEWYGQRRQWMKPASCGCCTILDETRGLLAALDCWHRDHDDRMMMMMLDQNFSRGFDLILSSPMWCLERWRDTMEACALYLRLRWPEVCSLLDWELRADWQRRSHGLTDERGGLLLTEDEGYTYSLYRQYKRLRESTSR